MIAKNRAGSSAERVPSSDPPTILKERFVHLADSPTWYGALLDAVTLMEQTPDLEPLSALKQTANDHGIAYGEEMGRFTAWAMTQF